MAPIQDGSAFLPALDRFLERREQVISWKSLYTCLSYGDIATTRLQLERVLKDEAIRRALVDPYSAFTPPSAATKSQFDSRTAAIHVPTSGSRQSDFKQIKEDAVWLSQAGQVDEISALRITLLEWQERAQRRLLRTWSREEIIRVRDVVAVPSHHALADLTVSAEEVSAEPTTVHLDQVRRTILLHLLWDERSYLYQTSYVLAAIAQPRDLQWRSAQLHHVPSESAGYLRSIGEPVWKGQCEIFPQTGTGNAVIKGISVLKDYIKLFADTSTWPEQIQDNDTLAQSYTASLLDQMSSVLQLIQLHSARSNTQIHGPSEVLAWFELVDESSFFSVLGGLPESLLSKARLVHGLVAVISVAVLRITPTIEYIKTQFQNQGSAPYPSIKENIYIEDEACVKQITSCLLAAASASIGQAGPTILAWSLIAQNIRLAAPVSEHGAMSEDGLASPPISRRSSLKGSANRRSQARVILGAILDQSSGDDAINYLANMAVNNMQALSLLAEIIDFISGSFPLPTSYPTLIATRMTAFALVQNCPPFITYSPELVAALLSALQYGQSERHLGDVTGNYPTWPLQPALSLKEDASALRDEFMPNVVSRFPLELDSFLQCMQSVARSRAYIDDHGSALVELLENLNNFTVCLPVTFKDYELVPSSELDGAIRLLKPLPIFSDSRRGVSAMPKQSAGSNAIALLGEGSYIPAGTVGRVLRDERPFIVTFHHVNSSLSYLGALLSTLSQRELLTSALVGVDFDYGTAADTVGLINALLAAARLSKDEDSVKLVLDSLSESLPRQVDIVTVIFDILESQLQSRGARQDNADFISLLVQSLKFVELLLPLYPERVWSHLARSGLLPADEGPGAIRRIVGATELPLGQFHFLEATLSLCGSLVSDRVSRAGDRSGDVVTKALTRFEQLPQARGRTSGKSQSTTLFNFVRVALDVLQSQPSWSFNEDAARYRLVEIILRLLTSILSHSTSVVKSELFSTFQAAAANIVTTFLSDNTTDLAVQSLSDVFVAGVAAAFHSRHDSFYHQVVATTASALEFCSLLLRVGILQDRGGSVIQKHLHQIMPVLVRLYAAHPAWKAKVAEVLTLLVKYTSASSQDPPSLLGSLSLEATRSFIDVLTNVSSPLQSLKVDAVIWDLLSTVISNKQQWLAISLLTGSTPRERLRTSRDEEIGKKSSLVDYALNELVHISSMAPRRAIGLLTFLSHAQHHWTWISHSLSERSDAVNALISWLSSLAAETKQSYTEAALRVANENQITALVADILADLLHNSPEQKRSELIKSILPELSFLRDNGAAVDGFNQSLHKNLARNFEQKFCGCRLNDFKRSGLRAAELGRDYYYDLELADRVLGNTTSWRRGKGQGFVDEVARANVNFSLVDSQIALLKSWKGLLLEVSQTDLEEHAAQQDLVKVITGCLQANIGSPLPTVLFENVSQIRGDLVFALLQRLTTVRNPVSGLKTLFSLAWDTLRATGFDFEVLQNARDATYYRTLLQILFLSLQSHGSRTSSKTKQSTSLTKSADTKPIPVTPFATTVQEIMAKVIANNFRALCTIVHGQTASEPSIAEPSDFVLLTALLQSLLRVPVSEPVERQLANTVASTNLVRYATSLYSWADGLTPGDPVYGELSVIFLLSLSTMPLVAEQMAVEGVLSILATANVSQPFRTSPASMTDDGKTVRSRAAKAPGPFDNPLRLHAIWSRGILPLSLNILSAVGPGIAPEMSSFLNGFGAQIRRCESDLTTPLSPTAAEPHRGCISLGLAAEAHSLALLTVVLTRLRDQAAAVGLNALDVEPLAFDVAGVLEAVQGMLRGRRGLRERIVPVGERDGILFRRRAAGSEDESVLETMVVAELKGVVECLSTI